mgnify:CR=1 FL=1
MSALFEMKCTYTGCSDLFVSAMGGSGWAARFCSIGCYEKAATITESITGDGVHTTKYLSPLGEAEVDNWYKGPVCAWVKLHNRVLRKQVFESLKEAEDWITEQLE